MISATEIHNMLGKREQGHLIPYLGVMGGFQREVITKFSHQNTSLVHKIKMFYVTSETILK